MKRVLAVAVLVLVPLTVSAAVLPVQTTANVGRYVTSLSLPMTSPTVAGNTLIAAFDFATVFSSITDSQGNTFTEGGTQLTTPGGAHNRVYVATGIKGGADTISISLTGSSAYLEVYVSEFSGVNTAAAVDAQSGSTGAAGSVSSGNINTKNLGDLLYGYCVGDSACTVGSGFTALSMMDGNLVESELSGVPGVYAANAIATAGWSMQLVALSPAAAPLPPVISTDLTAMLNEVFSYQVQASNSPTSFTATNLPAGLSISPQGIISGTPTAPGKSSVTVTSMNAYGSSLAASFQIVVTGAAPVHSVTLTWINSPTIGVVGYNVFRGTAAGAESLTPINQAPVQSGFVDMAVIAGLTYYYYLTAVASSGAQSGPSNEAAATVPSP